MNLYNASYDSQTRERLRNDARVTAAGLDDQTLAHRIRIIAQSPRSYSPEMKFGLLYEAAERIEYKKGQRDLLAKEGG